MKCLISKVYFSLSNHYATVPLPTRLGAVEAPVLCYTLELNNHSVLIAAANMERESLEMDVVFVGAGPANLSGALHLANLLEKAKGGEKDPGEIQIAVIEKGASIGAHTLSGAVMDPKGLAELIPDFVAQGAPLESPVKEDHFLYLTRKRAIRS